MKLSMTLLALGCGIATMLAGCDHSDRRTDAGEARDQAEAGQVAAQSPGGAEQTGTSRQPSDPSGMTVGSRVEPRDGGQTTLAMSGTPASHLVDGAGSAVYVLAGNADGSKCDAACQEAWPPVLAHEAQAGAGTGVEASRIGTLERNGRTHVTYGGQPLYRYAADAGAGRTAGAGVQDQWGKWSLVGLDGQPLADPAAPGD
ncbi:hypothetical protein [Luteimonas sp. MC1750]|uniref:hypothetical protein n=2 Tax=Luteimonas sp. MC1750 TaxID=2799326 RepID=UPI0018F0D0C8|nr:hypothetical protein [Luteimonas sp. MC1750]MBJ6983691.1 hypothetical protein [Luteimonas sp. MC1750]